MNAWLGNEPDDVALSRAFRALGHPHRLAIVRALLVRELACCAGERSEDCRLDPASCNVGALSTEVDVAPSTVSHHLKELDAAGVIERVRDGRFLYCRIRRGTLDLLADFLASGPGAEGHAA